MALTIANEVRQAALNGITPLFNNGQFVLTTAADAELATLTFGATAFAAASNASPSVAASNVIGADSSVTAGTIGKFLLKTSGAATRINGTVGTSGADLNVTDNVIPANATQVSCTGGLSLTLQLS